MIDDFQRPPQRTRNSFDPNRYRQVPANDKLKQPELGQLPVQTQIEKEPAPKANGFGSQSFAGHPPVPVIPHSDPAPTILLFKKWKVSRKKFFIVLAILILAFVSGGVYALVNHKNEPKAPVVSVKKTAPAAKPVAITSPLTGIAVTAEQQKQVVVGAMIENSPDARPQSGLKDAGMVYEAIAEAGITRFLAFYQEARPGNIGPIRSSRPYYLDWAMANDAAYAHVGGSPDALQRIKDIGVRDMDQFYNAGSYHRTTNRYAPHNVYTAVQTLADLAVSKGWATSSFTALSRKADQPSKTPTATSIDFGISSDFYNAHYDYDTAANNYKRSEGGSPHMDADSNTQLTPKVVLAMVMPYSLMDDGYHSQYNTQGTGKLYVFQDGTVMTGTWSKGEPKSQFVLKYDDGKTVALDAGQTWVSVVADAGKVTYK